MGLIHNFYLIKSKDLGSRPYTYKEILSIIDDKNYIYRFDIEDSIVEYFYDYLNWIPSIKMNTEKMNGLNRHGITIIDHTAVSIINSIFNGWLMILQAAPEIINLKGAFTLDENGYGMYETITMKKVELINIFNTIINISVQLVHEDYYLVHFGI